MLIFNFTKKKKTYKNLDPDIFELELLVNDKSLGKTEAEITPEDVTDLALKLNEFGFKTSINFTGK